MYMKHWSKVLDHLYIGNIHSAKDEDLYYEEFVEVVISLLWDFEDIEKVKKLGVEYGIEHYLIPLDDNDTIYLDIIFEQVLGIVQMAKKANKTVLIHCSAGQCRYVVMAMYCVAVELGLTIHDAIEFVEKARPESNVSEYFKNQLWKIDFKFI